MLLKEIITSAARSDARILGNPREVRRTDRDGSTPRDVKTDVATARLTPPSQNFNITSDSPTRIGAQDIVNPIGPAGPQWISGAPKLKTSIHGLFEKLGVLDPFSVK